MGRRLFNRSEGVEAFEEALLHPSPDLTATLEHARSTSLLHAPVRLAGESRQFFDYIHGLTNYHRTENEACLSPRTITPGTIARGKVMVESRSTTHADYSKTELVLSAYAADGVTQHNAKLTGWTHLAGQLTMSVYDRSAAGWCEPGREISSATAPATIGQLALGCNYAQLLFQATYPSYATENLPFPLSAQESIAILLSMGLSQPALYDC